MEEIAVHNSLTTLSCGGRLTSVVSICLDNCQRSGQTADHHRPQIIVHRSDRAQRVAINLTDSAQATAAAPADRRASTSCFASNRCLYRGWRAAGGGRRERGSLGGCWSRSGRLGLRRPEPRRGGKERGGPVPLPGEAGSLPRRAARDHRKSRRGCRRQVASSGPVRREPVGAGGGEWRGGEEGVRPHNQAAAAGNNHRMWAAVAGWGGHRPPAGKRQPAALKKVIKGRLTPPPSRRPSLPAAPDTWAKRGGARTNHPDRRERAAESSSAPSLIGRKAAARIGAG